MSNVNLIGANGFIGSALSQSLQDEGLTVSKFVRNANQFTPYHVQHGNPKEQIRIIVNLAGAWHNVTSKQMNEANYLSPLQILETDLFSSSKTLWIQASSYFQLYERVYGIPKNEYSSSKAELSKILKEKSGKNVKVIDMFLPHIIGPKEPDFRLFTSVARGKIDEKSVNLSSGKTVLPILDVRDLSTQIIKRIQEAADWEALSAHEEYFPEVSEIDSLKSILLESIKIDSGMVNFGILPDRENEFREKNVLAGYYSVSDQLRTSKASFEDQCRFLSGENL